MGQIKRRDILKAGAIGAAAAGLGFPAIIRAQQKEIVILGLWDQTGAFADVGPINDRGMRMALEERGMKVLGPADQVRHARRRDAGGHLDAARRGGDRRRRRELHHRAVVLRRGARGVGGGQAQEGGAPLQRRHRGHLRARAAIATRSSGRRAPTPRRRPWSTTS